jgi:hypothetical protein
MPLFDQVQEHLQRPWPQVDFFGAAPEAAERQVELGVADAVDVGSRRFHGTG